MESIYEQFFFLKYAGGWSLSEAYNLPIGLRVWFVKRLAKQLKDEKEAIEEAQKNSGSSSSQTHTLSKNSPKPPSYSKKY